MFEIEVGLSTTSATARVVTKRRRRARVAGGVFAAEALAELLAERPGHRNLDSVCTSAQLPTVLTSCGELLSEPTRSAKLSAPGDNTPQNRPHNRSEEFVDLAHHNEAALELSIDPPSFVDPS